MDNWVTYLLECNDGSLYCGATNNIEKRVATHNSGKGAKYTRGRLPVSLLVTSRQMSNGAALRLEYEVKQQNASAKVVYLRQFSRKIKKKD